jgi:hypothetical protein
MFCAQGGFDTSIVTELFWLVDEELPIRSPRNTQMGTVPAGRVTVEE